MICILFALYDILFCLFEILLDNLYYLKSYIYVRISMNLISLFI